MLHSTIKGDWKWQDERNPTTMEKNMKSEKYNGYANYETFATYSWVANDYDIYQECINLSHNADALQEIIEDYCFTSHADSGLSHDLIAYALDRVNWVEIQESLTGEYDNE